MGGLFWGVGGGGGGAKAMLAPSQIIGGGGGGWPPFSYAYAYVLLAKKNQLTYQSETIWRGCPSSYCC